MTNKTRYKTGAFIYLPFLALLFFSLPGFAADTEKEIAHLLDYIENSGCTFNRNWQDHDSVKARSHMEMKYDYAKDKITTTEQFIKYIATKSSITGKAYTITCKGIQYYTAEWLSEELMNYRANINPVH